ncbi:uncharacterized protein [Tenebrio molitor]|uniref:uncharacterized protein n=1 Tax=Tenebrio molitor TaxID=7067 RepID=UPI0036248A52
MLLLKCAIFLTVITSLLGEGCDKNGIIIYEDLGCTPHYDEGNDCPSKYTCEGLEPSSTSCYFQGKAYQDGEPVEDDLLSRSCNVGCFCSVEEKPGFVCAILDCPEWLGVRIEPGCYRNYTLENCCSVGEICPPFDQIEKCVVDGEEYREGEMFYVEKSCLNCVCRKGFKGKFEEPFCTRRKCGQQLRYADKIERHCAPFYGVDSDNDVVCCPEGWICSDGTEGGESEAEADSCKFGEMSFKVGQEFEKFMFADNYGKTHEKVKCKCVTPPLMKCIKG